MLEPRMVSVRGLLLCIVAAMLVTTGCVPSRNYELLIASFHDEFLATNDACATYFQVTDEYAIDNLFAVASATHNDVTWEELERAFNRQADAAKLRRTLLSVVAQYDKALLAIATRRPRDEIEEFTKRLEGLKSEAEAILKRLTSADENEMLTALREVASSNDKSRVAVAMKDMAHVAALEQILVRLDRKSAVERNGEAAAFAASALESLDISVTSLPALSLVKVNDILGTVISMIATAVLENRKVEKLDALVRAQGPAVKQAINALSDHVQLVHSDRAKTLRDRVSRAIEDFNFAVKGQQGAMALRDAESLLRDSSKTYLNFGKAAPVAALAAMQAAHDGICKYAVSKKKAANIGELLADLEDFRDKAKEAQDALKRLKDVIDAIRP